jgi:hypothetical protein
MKKLLLILALLPSAAYAQLDQTQISALHTAALADPTAVACMNVGDDGCLNNYLNSPTTFVVWRTSVPQEEITGVASFDWTRVDNLSVGKARIWDWMFRNGPINAANSNVRAGIDATWTGTAADLAVRASVYTKCKRFATVAEKVLATGTGTDAVPGVTTFDGSVPFQDTVKIRLGQ